MCAVCYKCVCVRRVVFVESLLSCSLHAANKICLLKSVIVEIYTLNKRK